MQVHNLKVSIDLALPTEPQFAGFCERLMYQSLDSNLKTGRMTTFLNDKVVVEADARRMVAHARAQGWLPKTTEGL